MLSRIFLCCSCLCHPCAWYLNKFIHSARWTRVKLFLWSVRIPPDDKLPGLEAESSNNTVLVLMPLVSHPSVTQHGSGFAIKENSIMKRNPEPQPGFCTGAEPGLPQAPAPNRFPGAILSRQQQPAALSHFLCLEGRKRTLSGRFVSVWHRFTLHPRTSPSEGRRSRGVVRKVCWRL